MTSRAAHLRFCCCRAMPLAVTRVTTAEQRATAYALRFDVFITEQQFDPELEIDEYDELPTTVHFLGRDTDSGKYVATARCIVFADERKGKIGRVAVLRQCRGKKYGAALMHAVEQEMQAQCDRFVLSAQFDKRAFYEKCGYERLNDEIHLDEGVEHCWMVKRVAA